MKKHLLALYGALFFSAFLLHTDNSVAFSTANPPTADTFQIFGDIALQNYSSSAMQGLYFLKKRDIIKGYPDGTIKLNQNINRAEFIKSILQAKKGIEIYYDPKFTFADNPETAWYAKYLSTAKRLGIISGYPDGFFRPENPINYVEGLKILSTAFPLKPGNSKAGYNKIILQPAAGKWYYAPLKNALSQNIIEQRYAYNFRPDSTLTRGRAFDSIYRSLIASEFPIGHFESPRIVFDNSNSFLLMHPKENFQIPIAYENITEKAKIHLYRVPVEIFLKGIINGNYYSRSAPFIRSDLISQMELLEQFETEIKPVSEETDPNSPYQKGYISLEISDPGLYFFVVENDYILPQHHFLDVTRNMILVKSAEKNQLIWIADYETQNGRPNINIDLYQRLRESSNNYDTWNIKKVSTINTADNGIYLGPGLEAQYLVATEGNDISILQAGLYNRSSDEDTRKEYRSHIYTDRPVYRPGDTVYLKSIIRSKIDQNYELLKDETVSLKISAYGTSGEIAIFEKNYTPSSFSTISDEFKLNPEDLSGSYQIILNIDNAQIGYGQFEVQAYKKSEYTIEINPEKEKYFIGDTVKAKITGNYFFGAPLKNQKINYVLKRHQERYFYPMPMIDYDMGIGIERSIFFYPQGEEIIKEGEAMLDNNGEYTVEFSAQKNTDSENQYAKSITYIIDVSSVDTSNIPVTASKIIPVYLAAFEMEISEKTVYPTAGQEYNLEIKTLDQNEKIYPDAALTIKSQLRKSKIGPIYFNHWIDEYLSRIEYEDEYEDLATYTLSSNSQGIALLNITPDKEGQYRFLISAQDSSNNKIEAEFQTTIHAASPQTKYRYLNQNLITMTPDKDEYEVGDTATILLNIGQNPANILFVTAQKEILNFTFQNTDSGSQEITLPITEKMLGGLLVSADVLHKYQFFDATKQLKISPASKKLAITITPQQKQYRPQENSTFQITVTDNASKPVTGELSLSLVDKAIFDILASNPESDILKKFYTAAYYHLDNQSTKIGTSPLGGYAGAYYDEANDGAEDAEGAFGRLGQPDLLGAKQMATLAPEAPSGTPTDPARQEFLDTAYFNGTIITDSNGQATISAKLPDNLTTWVADVIGVTLDTKIGQSSAEIIVNKDFFLSPHVPRFVTKGDRLTLRVTARNQQSATDKFLLSLSGNGFTILSAAEKQVTIAAGENITESWNIEVTGSEKLELEFAMTALEGNSNDTVHLSLPINLFGDDIVNSISGEDQGEIPINLQSSQVANLRSLIVTLSPTLADNLIKSLEYLVGFPYGCVEQTMSKFLPNVVVYQNKDRLNLNNQNLFKDLPEQVQSGLKRLYNLQHPDGGWGWWETDETQPKNTAYVVYGLHLAEKAGFKVEKEALQRGLEQVNNYLSNTRDERELSLSNKIYLNYVYTLASGRKHENLNEILKQNQTNLKVIDHAYLALNLKILGDLEGARSHLQLLKASVKEISDRAYVEESAPDYEFMQSSSLSTALALEALAKISPTDPLIPKIIRYINANNEEGSFHETHATAHSVIALVSYLAGIQESDQALKYTITLNGQTIESSTLDQIKKIEIPNSKLTGQNDRLIIQKDSGSKLYFTVTTREFINQTNITAFNNGLELKRNYYDEKGNPLGASISVGSVIKIGLDLKSSVKGKYLLIKDPLPAGFEPINSALSGGQRYYNYRSGSEWGSRTSHRDFLDDHTALFVDYLNPEEPQTYYYYARAVTPGTFHLNPAKAEMMYMPEISGGSGSKEIRIEDSI